MYSPFKFNNRADPVFSKYSFSGAFSLYFSIIPVMKTNTREAVSPSVQVNLPWSLGSVGCAHAPAGDC